MGQTLPSVENHCTEAMQYIYYERMDMYHCSASKSINLNASATTVSENDVYTDICTVALQYQKPCMENLLFV